MNVAQVSEAMASSSNVHIENRLIPFCHQVGLPLAGPDVGARVRDDGGRGGAQTHLRRIQQKARRRYRRREQGRYSVMSRPS